jgi:hypothetical protein
LSAEISLLFLAIGICSSVSLKWWVTVESSLSGNNQGEPGSQKRRGPYGQLNPGLRVIDRPWPAGSNR